MSNRACTTLDISRFYLPFQQKFMNQYIEILGKTLNIPSVKYWYFTRIPAVDFKNVLHCDEFCRREMNTQTHTYLGYYIWLETLIIEFGLRTVFE